MRRPSPGKVWRAVTLATGVGEEELRGDARNSRTVEARRICVAMMCDLCGLSFPEIAQWFGRRNHSTAVDQYHAWMDYPPYIRTRWAARIAAALIRQGWQP